MSGTTDTILIDCNRTNSAEKHTGSTNTSQFTCKVSDGLKVNVGDVISVHSGFISERGCGDGDVIEITGRDLQVDYEVEETELEKYQLYLNPYNNSGTDVAIPPEGTLPPNGALSYRYIQKSVPKRLADNKVSMSITYYKTNNGQGYAMLPRRFDLKKAIYNYDATGTTFGWGAHAFGTTPRQDNDGTYDSYTEGRPMLIDTKGLSTLQTDVKYIKNGTVPPTSGARSIIGQSAKTDKLFKYRQDNSRFTLMVCEQNYVGMASQFGIAAGDVRYVSDSTQGDDYDTDNTCASRDTYGLNEDHIHYRDPCLQEWIIYKETKDIEVETGFQSPEAIAKQISDQLQARKSLTTIYGTVGGTHAPPTPGNTQLLAQSPVTTFADSECYKAFPSANAVEFAEDKWTSYWTNKAVANPPTTADELNVIQYVQQYSTIAVKRPELWVAGRELLKNASQINAGQYHLAPQGNVWNPVGDTAKNPAATSWRNYSPGQMLNAVPFSDRNSNVHNDNKIVTSYLWNEENLKYFKELFRQQGRDESLFKTGNNALGELPFGDIFGSIASSNSRFIHMNTEDGTNGVYPYDQLGCDNYENQINTLNNPDWQFTDPTGKEYLRPKNGNSMPIFITFEPERENIASGGNQGKEHDMYYGFAIRETVQMEAPAPPHALTSYDVISFNTSRVGGIVQEAWGRVGYDWTAPIPGSDFYYLSGDSAGTSRLEGYVNPRKLGYDPHFNAYGTASMVLYSGLLDGSDDTMYYIDTDAQGDTSKTTRPVVHKIKQRYVGANEPTMNWDPDESKFQIQALHTPEYTGNTETAGSSESVPINADSGQPVWQINKHLLKRDFCPDMMPYLKEISFTGGTAKVSQSNPNIEPWEPFDALCGIFIESFNIDEDHWQDSLMGIMGFEYKQFNSLNTLNQRQRRLNDEISFTPQGSLTTNAVIKSSDLIQFTTNVYGAQMYETQLPCIVSDPISKTTTHAYYSVISDKQVSCSIEAQRLPRKMLTPYYIIRSDIISDAQYQSNGKTLPIVYVVNKENGFGDFFFQNTTETNFVVTKERVITDVTTSIHNPDMSLAPTDEGSGIIYKIIKNNMADMNVAEEILNKNKKK